jgi:hypothetical protein
MRSSVGHAQFIYSLKPDGTVLVDHGDLQALFVQRLAPPGSHFDTVSRDT